MKRIVRRMAMASAALVLLAGLAGCSASEDGSNRGTVINGGIVESNWDLPFAPYAPVVNRFTQEDNSVSNGVFKKRFDQLEAYTAQCMQERGFSYFPEEWTDNEDDPGYFPQGDSLWLPELPTTREEAVRVGYGTQPAEQFSWTGEHIDKNEDYRLTLSPSARGKYDLARYGQNPYEPEDPSLPKSCGVLARENVPPHLYEDDEVIVSFNSQFGDVAFGMHMLVSDEIFGDPRIIKVSSQWNQCMKGRGRELISGSMYTEETVQPWASHYMALAIRADGVVGDSWKKNDIDNTTPEEERSLLGTEAEIKIAVDDFDCRVETNYMETFAAVQIELENQFIQDHYQQLQDMLAFAEEHPI
ncbi:MAG: hypothetical protein FWG15_04975 [Propionibacteriaceae bacterium]|nr:hypothetical protein [Propionibacteriaceae bacterium]